MVIEYGAFCFCDREQMGSDLMVETSRNPECPKVRFTARMSRADKSTF